VLIRRFELNLDRFMFIDHSRREPVEREFALQFVRTCGNVTDLRRLLASAALDELFKTGGAGGNLLPVDVAGAIDRALRAGPGVRREPAREPRQF